MIVKKERHLRIMTAARQTHHGVTTTQTYPTQIRTERESSQHNDVEASTHESTGPGEKRRWIADKEK